MTAALDKIAKAAAVLQQSEDPDINEIGDAFAGWIAAGAIEPIGKALALTTWGGVSPARSIAIDERNRALRRLYADLPEFRSLAPAAAARAMVQAFDRYETDRWQPREKDHVDAPSAEPAATFWRILKSKAPMLRADRLRQILADEIQDPV
jgi:hypothetical protein